MKHILVHLFEWEKRGQTLTENIFRLEIGLTVRTVCEVDYREDVFQKLNELNQQLEIFFFFTFVMDSFKHAEVKRME